MQAALDLFRLNISRVRALGAMYKVLTSQTTPVVELSDILRAELVLAVSAFDHFIHELTRMGMLEVYQGNRAQPPAFLRFQISLERVLQSTRNPGDVTWLDQEIRIRHSWQSFQQADRVADAIRLGSPAKLVMVLEAYRLEMQELHCTLQDYLRLVSDIRLWDEVARSLGTSPREVKEQLNLIVDRRNKIAHESDIDPTFADGSRWPIDEPMVDEAIDFIERVAEAIFALLP